ncbi:MAG: hypothetical protein QOG05_314 [Streptosporangiaceae bacterium]|jgi:hypothetical protein|nr:hypothetical protein [Streptosporangiaceae bacterium]
MNLTEIGGTCQVDQLLSFGWLPYKALHLGREDNIDLIFLYEFNKALEIRALSLRVLRCTDVILFEDDNDLDPQAMLSGIMPEFFKTFDNLYGSVPT